MDSITAEYIISSSYPIFPKCGVYFLIKDNEIVYVGRSIHLRTRLNTHGKTKDFNRVFFIECQPEEIGELEMHYIKKFDPPLNQVKPKPVVIKPPKKRPENPLSGVPQPVRPRRSRREENDPQDYSRIAILCRQRGWKRREFLAEAAYHTRVSIPVLERLYKGGSTSKKAIIEQLANLFNVAEDEIIEIAPGSAQAEKCDPV